MIDILLWLQQWYKNRCDGYWEHSNRILIESLDNPGWGINIDLLDTPLAELQLQYEMPESTDDDWYEYSIKEGKFSGYGDQMKLTVLLEKFKILIQTYSNE